MTLRRFVVLAGMAVCLISESAVAQVPTGNLPTFDTAPAGAPQGAMGGPQGGFGAPPPQESPCMREFNPLREAAEKRAGILKVAIDRKADRSEFCKLFKDFATAEGKVVKFMTDNQSTCNIPPQAVT